MVSFVHAIFVYVCYDSNCQYHGFSAVDWLERHISKSGADPDMGRPAGHLPHWPKVGAGCGCEKQSASDMGVNYHLNP